MEIAAALIDGSPDGLLAFDRECRYVLWNPAMERLSGLPASQVLGRVAWELFPFLAETGEIEHFHAALRGETAVSREKPFRIPETGSIGFFDGHYLPVRRGSEVVGGAAIIRNVTGRHRNRIARSAQDRVSQVLVESDAADAPMRMLAAIGETTGWECGAYWTPQPHGNGLRCTVAWHRPDQDFGAYVAASLDATLEVGDGLPGGVWQAARGAWIEDISRDDRYRHSPLARKLGLLSGVAFPVRVAGRAAGVMEFFSRRASPEDRELLELLEDLAAQFGQFMDRQQAQASLAETRALFTAVFEQAPFSAQIFAPDGVCLHANAAFETLWGAPRQYLQGYNLLRDPQLEALELMPLIRRAFAGEAVVLPPVHYDPARNKLPGRGRWTQASLYPIIAADVGVREVVLIHQDVTERVQLDTERAHLRVITEAALSHPDLDAMLPVALDRLRSSFGADMACLYLRSEGRLSTAGAVGMPEGTELPGTGELLRSLIASRHPRILQSADSFGLAEALATCGIASGMAAPLMLGSEVEGLLLVGGKTASRFSSEDLRLLQLLGDRLALAVAHAAHFKELRENNRRKDEFLATLAHELRNPLAPILTAAEVLRLKVPEDPTLLRASQAITRQVDRMRGLIDDLLDVARLTRGIVVLKRSVVDLRRAAEDALATAMPAIEQRRHEVTVRLPEDSVMVDGDPARLEQVIVNLLTNAAKFTPPGGRIELAVEREGEEAVARVRDSGKGIPPEMLPRVFELFVQVDPSLDRAEGGLGLGLTLVRSLVEMHGGRVEAWSEGLGYGAEFRIRLPAVADRRAGAALEADEVPEGATYRVLVVDDNEDAATTLAQLLELWGHEVRVVGDGESALEVQAEFAAHVVLLDLGLPGIDGFETARRLRSNAHAPDRIVALTGYGQDEDRNRSHAAGFDAHLVKPADPEAVRRVLAGR